jgi:hypothetical protein
MQPAEANAEESRSRVYGGEDRDRRRDAVELCFGVEACCDANAKYHELTGSHARAPKRRNLEEESILGIDGNFVQCGCR